MIERIEEECGLLSMCDVVFNHTASNTAWLSEHPEAGYSLANSPHLRPAYAVDVAIREFSDRLDREFGDLAEVRNQGDVGEVLRLFFHHALEPLRLIDYFVLDIEGANSHANKLDNFYFL